MFVLWIWEFMASYSVSHFSRRPRRIATPVCYLPGQAARAKNRYESPSQSLLPSWISVHPFSGDDPQRWIQIVAVVFISHDDSNELRM